MDPLDAFYQQFDSEALLDQHGPELTADAREAIRDNPAMRVAGLITMPDSADAAAVREMLAKVSGQDVPADRLMVGIVPRELVEKLLSAYNGDGRWREEPWQPQQVLPVVVSTRDGFRFGFFGLGGAGQTATE